VTSAVHQFECATRCEKLLEPLPPKGPPAGPKHQHHEARVYEQGAGTPDQPLTGRQTIGMAPELPAPATQQLFEPVEAVLRISHADGFRQAELAELARGAVVDPAKGGPQCRPLAPPAAEQQRQRQPGQQGKKPAAGVNMIELEGQQAPCVKQSEPGLGVIEAVVELLVFLLGNQGTDRARQGDHHQKGDGQAQI
jgi:hypothetical protein